MPGKCLTWQERRPGTAVSVRMTGKRPDGLRQILLFGSSMFLVAAGVWLAARDENVGAVIFIVLGGLGFAGLWLGAVARSRLAVVPT